MNTKDSNLYKIIAAVLIGVVLIFMIGIVANGWQQYDNNGEENSGDTDETIDQADNPNGDTDENEGTADNINSGENNNTSDNKDDEDIVENKPFVPQFVNYLTGLECNEEEVYAIPYVFTVEPNAPLYGISDSDITIEIPTEGGQTRFLIYRSDISGLGKIGALSPTRDYITQLTKFFGGTLVAYGEDDIISYSSIASTLHIDLSQYTDYIYKENGKNIYTDNQNIIDVTQKEGIDSESYKTQEIPFVFCDFKESVTGKTQAVYVTIPYSDNNNTVLTYDKETDSYLFSKGGRSKVDMLTGKNASYTNVFILFSDMITYELSSGTQTVMETATKGTGYYITGGTLKEIRWSVDSKKQLIFKDLNGEKLIVNRGTSYIGYYKASDTNSVGFE